MAETTSFRFSLLNWGASTDGPSRVEFNTNFTNIDLLAAIDRQNTFASRPAAGVQGTYFWDTTNEYLWRDTGTGWKLIGQKAQDQYIRSSSVGVVPLTVDAIAAQTADLLQLKVNSVSKFTVDKDGNTTLAAKYAGTSASYVNDTAATAVVFGKGAASQSAALLQLRDSTDADKFVVSAAGAVTSPFLSSSASSTVVNATSASSVANMLFWSGSPLFEVRGGSGGDFNEFVYLKRSAAGGTAATRRLGLVMKAGNEDAAGATHSAALYMRSVDPNFDNPTFRIDVGDMNIWDMRAASSQGSMTPFPVYANQSYFRSDPNGFTGAFQANSTWIGAQASNNQYYRAGNTSSGFYWYAGGVHDASPGNPGAGGMLYAQMLPEGSSVRFSTGKLQLNDVAEASLAQSSPTFMIGPANAMNLIMDNNEIHARNNGGMADLWLQPEMGVLHLGEENVRVEITGNGFAIGNEPVNKQTNDVWIDLSGGGAVKRWSGTSWLVVAD